MPLAARRALFIVNAHSRRGSEDVGAALDLLRAAGIEIVQPEMTAPEDIAEAIRAHQGGVDMVVVGGGDGTLNAAADALLATQLTLGILPLGTANDLARVLAIPTDPIAAAQIIVDGHRRRIDLGRANDHLFFNVATIGLSARLAEAMDAQTKRRFGALAYGITLSRIGPGRPFRATLRSESKTVRMKAIQIAVGNGRFHGGGVVVHEAAAIDDQLLHLYALKPQSLLALVGKLPWLLRGKHELTTNVLTLTSAELQVETDKSLPVNTDGELTTQTPVRFTVLPSALEVFTPP